jgi:hypothetical protein
MVHKVTAYDTTALGSTCASTLCEVAEGAGAGVVVLMSCVEHQSDLWFEAAKVDQLARARMMVVLDLALPMLQLPTKTIL